MKLVRESIEDTLKPRSKDDINKDIDGQLGTYKEFLQKNFLKNEDKVKPEDIRFDGGQSNSMGYGYGSGNPKLSYQIDNLQPRWKALYRGDDEMGHKLMGLVTDFLNDKKTKAKIAKILNDETEYERKIDALTDKLQADGFNASYGTCRHKARELVDLSLRYIK